MVVANLSISKIVVATFAVLCLSGCASTKLLSQSELAALELTNPQIVGSKVLTSGQPSAADLATLKQKGFGTIITLRTPGEDPGFDEAAEARGLGLTYINIPVSMDKLDAETAQILRSAIAQSTTPTLVHCGSGNRVGALYAIGAYEIDGESVENALAIGRSAGLTRLEPKVRELLGQ
ncbi:MAG: hypothetical protein GKS03_16530 [Alphaproteobacteria bacterium]|nr:hypothetical protein [Alphaproteobacteria bacterium]